MELVEVLTRLRARPMDAPALDPLYPQDPSDEDPEPSVTANVQYEMALADWEPRVGRADCADPPRRFIDGSLRPHLVMSLEDARGRPRPMILATIGAVALDLHRAADGRELLSRHAHKVDTCVAFLANGLDTRDVDILSRACEGEGIRVVAPPMDKISTDFDEVRTHTLDLPQGPPAVACGRRARARNRSVRWRCRARPERGHHRRGLGSLDADGIDAMAEHLRDESDRLDRVVLVTHQAAMRRHFSSGFLIRRKNGTSVIEPWNTSLGASTPAQASGLVR